MPDQRQRRAAVVLADSAAVPEEPQSGWVHDGSCAHSATNGMLLKCGVQTICKNLGLNFEREYCRHGGRRIGLDDGEGKQMSTS